MSPVVSPDGAGAADVRAVTGAEDPPSEASGAPAREAMR